MSYQNFSVGNSKATVLESFYETSRVSMKMYIITTDSWGVIVCQSSDYFRKNKNITECFQVCHGNEGHNTAGSRADGKRV